MSDGLEWRWMGVPSVGSVTDASWVVASCWVPADNGTYPVGSRDEAVIKEGARVSKRVSGKRQTTYLVAVAEHHFCHSPNNPHLRRSQSRQKAHSFHRPKVQGILHPLGTGSLGIKEGSAANKFHQNPAPDPLKHTEIYAMFPLPLFSFLSFSSSP